MLESLFPVFGSLLAQTETEITQVPFYRQTGFLFLLLIAAVALGLLLARMIANSLKLDDYRGKMGLVLIPMLIAALMIWSKWPPKFGVDLRGGMNFVGALNLDAWSRDDDGSQRRPTAADIIPDLVRRVDPSGTSEISIRPLGSDKIEVTIPETDLEQANKIWDRLAKVGKLEFRILADSQYTEHGQALRLARELANEGRRDRDIVITDADGNRRIIAYWATLAREVGPGGSIAADAPIKYIPERGQLLRNRATGELIDVLSIPFSNNRETHGREFSNWLKSRNIRSPQILLMQPAEPENVEGSHLFTVTSDMDELGRACVGFVTSDQGALRMGTFTRKNEKKLMGIVLDDQLHSAATIQEAITKRGRITGSFTREEVDEIVNNLRSGKLDVTLNKTPISQNFINSTLGEELKAKGIWSIAISLALVLAFMAFYYRTLGILACFVLALNALLVLALVMAIEYPLTLTGLAGLVLTIGMAVDSNVLIFERIREELDRGAALRMAIRNGFDKAMSTIVDANVTTMITALVLYIVGTEQIKGFSVTLILGILVSMFTAIFVARLILDVAERKRWLTKVGMMRLLEKKHWTFTDKVPLTGILSTAVILAGLAGMYLLGNRILDQDLRGGSTARVVFNEPQNIDEIRNRLKSEEIYSTLNGEKIEFTVTGFGVLNADETSRKDREFKIDSNLQAWEGEGERWEQLDEILDRIFEGQLKKNRVDLIGVAAGETTEPSAGSDVSLVPAIRIPNGDQSDRAWVAVPFAISRWNPSILMNQMLVAGSQDESTGSLPTGENIITETIQDDASGNADMRPPLDLGDLLQELEESDRGGDFAVPQTPSANNEYVRVTRDLKFGDKISGQGIRELVLASADRLNLRMEEDEIELESPEIGADQSVRNSEASNWKISMMVSRPEDADQILKEWQQEFNQTTFFPTTSKVGSQIATEARWRALGAIIASLIGVILYIWIRFQNVAFGLAAVIALIHDVLVVLGAIAISHWLAGTLNMLGIVEFKISLEIVAALLTVIGYSLNDTIVVFDRIREVRGKQSKITAEMVNESISQTLSRTILTSMTTFIVVFILYCFGGAAIHGFAFALCVGVIVGTYSSIFVAAPALLWLMNTVGLNPGEVEAEPSTVV
jgi:SecD/SecF fusion protein